MIRALVVRTASVSPYHPSISEEEGSTLRNIDISSGEAIWRQKARMHINAVLSGQSNEPTFEQQ